MNHTEMLYALKALLKECKESESLQHIAAKLDDATEGWLPVEREVRVGSKVIVGEFCRSLDWNGEWGVGTKQGHGRACPRR